jgi:hypothetical protein
MNIGDWQQANFKALASLLKLALNCTFFGAAGFQIVIGTQHIKIGFTNTNDQRLLISGKL